MIIEHNGYFIKLFIYEKPFDYEGKPMCLERQRYIHNLDFFDKEDSRLVWRLLETSFRKMTGENLNDYHPRRLESGRWVIDKYEISLSHSGDFYAVAISSKRIGIDVQKVREFYFNKDRIWSKGELEIVKNLREYHYRYAIWTRKEALYKILDSNQPYNKETQPNIDTTKYDIFRNWIIDGRSDDYFLSVASPLIKGNIQIDSNCIDRIKEITLEELLNKE